MAVTETIFYWQTSYLLDERASLVEQLKIYSLFKGSNPGGASTRWKISEKVFEHQLIAVKCCLYYHITWLVFITFSIVAQLVELKKYYPVSTVRIQLVLK